MDENWNNYFEYNENSPSGLIWKVSQGKVKSGAMAGAEESRCWRVRLHGKGYKAHRIIWFLFHNVVLGKSEQIDHIDRNPFNNRIDNLRVVTQKINNRNRNKRKNNKTGVTGVSEIYYNNELRFYTSSWYDEFGTAVSVNFNVVKIGKDLAFRFAKELREAKIAEMSQSMGYTLQHGK